MINKIKKLKNKKGEIYLDTVIGFIILTLMFVFIVNTFTVIFNKQDIDYFSKEMAKIASVEGMIDKNIDFTSNPGATFDNDAIQKRFEDLLKDTGFDKNKLKVSWDATNDSRFDYDAATEAERRKIQYGEQLTVYLTYDIEVSGVGAAAFNGNKTSSYSALSQIYWKAS